MRKVRGNLQAVETNRIEFSTFLGNICGLLNSENIHEELKKICFSSRCGCFLKYYTEGITPFMNEDPIELAEYNGRYWPMEGKHRSCLAKMAGIKTIQAYVSALDRDIYSTLPNNGDRR
jgi:hypothetical protein